MEFLYFILLISLVIPKCWAGNQLKCTLEFCDDYVQKFPCPPLDPACSNPNKSIVLPSPTICNCCEICFLFQDIGEDCVVGRPGQPLPNVICKPGTECKNGICVKKNQPDFDFYPGYECKNNMAILRTGCTCTVLENSLPKKIFGSFPETPKIKEEKQCACSLAAYHAKNSINPLLPSPDLFLPIARCLPNGQYDPLQCIDNLCGCVNRTTGSWYMSEQKVPIAGLGPNNPKCFDKSRHKVGEYYTPCERERNLLMADKLWADTEKVQLLFSKKLNCLPNGEYGPVSQ